MTIPDPTTLASFWSPTIIHGNVILVMHLLGSLMLGMLVGYERSYHGRAAGMRTFSLVCMASTGIISAFGYPELWFGGQHVTAITVDGPSRVIQGIVTGIGFLGAGVILHEGRSVSGLSTAASIWSAAAIGILVGLGLYMTAISLALLCAFSMSIVLQFERWLPKQKRYFFELTYTSEIVPDSAALKNLAAGFGLTLRLDTVGVSLSKSHQYCSFTATSAAQNHTDINGLANALRGINGLEKFTITPARN